MAWYEDFWDDTLYYFHNFINYFEAQDAGFQILIGFLVVLAFIAAGLLVYGLCWLVFQLVKISIIGMIILHYLVFVGIRQFVMLFYASPAEINEQWERSLDNIETFFNRCYPKKPDKPVKQDMGPERVFVPVPRSKPARPPVVDRRRRMHQKFLIERSKRREEWVSKQIARLEKRKMKMRARWKNYCPNCGNAFTLEMMARLDTNNYCYCQKCGGRFVGNIRKPIFVPNMN
ncbi:MAG: hypothetical protein ACTSUE_24385 [Promethearchaeota archaeon]